MKYIKTKNGIYDLDKSIWYEFTERKVKMPYCEEYEKQPELCKTADTLVELCDKFVVIGYYTNKPLIFDTLLEAQQFVYDHGCQDKDYIEIKGAIWTDKGLSYIAKINNKKDNNLSYAEGLMKDEYNLLKRY